MSVTGGTSAPTLVDVTVTPPTDTPTIATASFRCDKKRLTLTANTNVVDPNLQLTLQPYKTNAATSNTDAANVRLCLCAPSCHSFGASLSQPRTL